MQIVLNMEKTYRKMGFVTALALALGLSGACASTPKASEPTAELARTAVALHRAEQSGANYTPEGRALCVRSQAALEESRRQVFRGNHDQAKKIALEGLRDAERARELAEARGLPQAEPVVGSAPVTTAAATLATY
jgi:hypothetical protein